MMEVALVINNGSSEQARKNIYQEASVSPTLR